MEMEISQGEAHCGQKTPTFESSLQAAHHWHRFGLNVIPIVPLLKKPAVKWDTWLDGLDAEKITSHWTKNPKHEVGFVVGEDILVLDADSPESVCALNRLEEEAGVPPLLVVTTKRGEHHYFRRAKDTYAKSDAYSTAEHPERIDVKTGRSIVVLPPSTGKVLKTCWVERVQLLFDVEQVFIDRVFNHNGREAPRLLEATHPATKSGELTRQTHKQIATLLELLDPEEGGYEEWTRIGMAIHTETDGDDEGLELFDQWSQGGRTYPGRNTIETKWRSFATPRADRCNMGTIVNRAKEAGHDWMEICSSQEDEFHPCEYEIVTRGMAVTHTEENSCGPVSSSNPLDKYSLRGMSASIAREAVKHQPILDGLAMLGQATAFFAPANSGKTLITLAGICNDIKEGRIDSSSVYYVNVDDSGQGLAEKLKISDEYGFHMFAEGYRDFRAAEMLQIMNEMVTNDQAKGVIVILDTIKKFTNPMDKTKASHFTSIIRKFVLKGGTVIGMAHTNKKPDSEGKPVYGGTSDIVDDFDCAYTVATEKCSDPQKKTVVFNNIKRRGANPFKVVYHYSQEPNVSYSELVMSLERLDAEELDTATHAKKIKSDSEVIAVVQLFIRQGLNTKMKLATEVAAHLRISRRRALGVIEGYCGNEPSKHKWSYVVREHGAQIFTLLDEDIISPR